MIKKNSVRFAAAALAVLIGASAHAQPVEGAAGNPAPDAAAALLAQRKQYAEAINAEAAKSQERLETINQQLRTLDKDIEARVDRIVALLSTIKDSSDSRGRVRRMKDKAIMGLRNSITYYARERERRNETLAAGGPAAAKEGLAEDVGVIDKRLDKRIDQILKLSSSMTQNEEFGRYERYRNDEYDYTTETTEYRRYEKDVDGSVKTKADVVKDLRSAIDKQSRSIKELQEQLRLTADPQRKERIQDQIAEKEEIVAERQKQIEELLTAPAPAAKAVSSKGAFEVDKLLAEMTLDLQSDFRTFQRLVSERNEAQVRHQRNQVRLPSFQAGLAAEQGQQPR